jgi:hypothetical protein
MLDDYQPRTKDNYLRSPPQQGVSEGNTQGTRLDDYLSQGECCHSMG